MILNAKMPSDIPDLDRSYFRTWTLEMLYEVEPELEVIAEQAESQKRRGWYNRLSAYTAAKKAAWALVGWYARDPRLRSHESWDCYFNHILGVLRL